MLNEVFGAGEYAEWPLVVLPRLIEVVSKAAREAEKDPPLAKPIHARLLGAIRAMDLQPVPLDLWGVACRGHSPLSPPSPDLAPHLRRPLGAEALKRLHVLVETLRDPAVGEVLRQRCLELGTGKVAVFLLVGFAAWAKYLMAGLLLKTPFRMEEFARKWTDAIGARVHGESPDESLRRLKEMDSGHAVGDLEEARRRRNDFVRRTEEGERRRQRHR